MSEAKYEDFYPAEDVPPRRFLTQPAEEDTTTCPRCHASEQTCDSLPGVERCCPECRNAGLTHSRATYAKFYPTAKENR
jgi:hypothetical protein